MEIINKFTAIRLISDLDLNDDEVKIRLTFGRSTGPYYDKTYPKEIFDSYDEAVEYAEKTDKYATWLILPVIKFNWFESN